MYHNKSVAIIIPARFGSTRLPGKPLKLIRGKPMIWWVYRAAQHSVLADKVVVATDDKRIHRVVENFGGSVVMTSTKHPSGTDRVAEAAKKIHVDVIVNVQGDQPLLNPAVIDKGIRCLIEKKAQVVTPITALRRIDVNNPHVVKVVKDKHFQARYFFRVTPPPGYRAGRGQRYRHVGTFFFTRTFLFRYASWLPTQSEREARLEQLRMIDHGYFPGVFLIAHDSPSVDTAKDLALVRKLAIRIRL